MNTINALGLLALLISATACTGPAANDYQPPLDANKKELANQALDATENHDHNDPKHRTKIILDSHEFANRTCSYDANCATGYRCDLHRQFHKGVCIRTR
ncbi:MAG: hypothetical protein V7629_20015 [Motiliproteus sp.]